MFCSNCGKQLIPDAKFCANCGASLPAAAPVQQAPVQQTALAPVQQPPVQQIAPAPVQQPPVQQAIPAPVQQPPVQQIASAPVQQAPVQQAAPAPVQQPPVQQAIPTPAQQAIPAPAQQAIPAPAQQTIPAPVQQPPVQQAAPAPVQQAPVQQTIPAPVQQAPVQQAAPAPVQQAPVQQAAPMYAYQQPVQPQYYQAPVKKKNTGLIIAIIAGGVVLLGVIIAILIIFGGNSETGSTNTGSTNGTGTYTDAPDITSGNSGYFPQENNLSEEFIGVYSFDDGDYYGVFYGERCVMISANDFETYYYSVAEASSDDMYCKITLDGQTTEIYKYDSTYFFGDSFAKKLSDRDDMNDNFFIGVWRCEENDETIVVVDHGNLYVKGEHVPYDIDSSKLYVEDRSFNYEYSVLTEILSIEFEGGVCDYQRIM